MKLVILTAVESYQKDIYKLFKKANIESYSGSEIEGFKNNNQILATSSWFPSIKGASESVMFFSFTENKNIETLFQLIEEYNQNIETNNPIRAVVCPIEKFI
ncbi:hypothetical protein [Flavobacterium sp. CS20]|jgi:hypothetical protein|uniref:hypothetical protein n=1 Tax=Flavobacterium sp. CS20 TaxID=2775246 RepID=UPI001B3A6F56|nr:hypothetical protein [Flavobacterium sp. CS20]QTY27388.1 hypothetical protein IGB25_02095 [Flavobacterium sp. CS20]